MALIMARPIKDKSSGLYRLKERPPADIATLVKGERLSLPIGDNLQTITVHEFVEVSLRTRDPAEARKRHAKADAVLREFWDAKRNGPKPLTHEQAVALAGVIYRRTVECHRADQTNSALYATEALEAELEAAKASDVKLKSVIDGMVRQAGLGLTPLLFTKAEFAKMNTSVDWYVLLETTFGVMADQVLTSEGLVIDATSRRLLLDCVRDAVVDANKQVVRNVKGNYAPDPNATRFPPVEVAKRGSRAKLTITGLLKLYLKELQVGGRGKAAEKRWTPVFEKFAAFLGHDDAGRVTKADVVKWKEHRLADGLAAKTIKDTDLASLKAVFGWAVDNAKLSDNPALGVKIKVTKTVRSREKGFTDTEAIAVLKAARGYMTIKGELEKTADAKRWTPWLCAFSGARINEMCQLRKEDITDKDGIHVMRLTPEAGSIKSGQYRDVPLHPQLLELGFLKFVAASSDGPLFYRVKASKKPPVTIANGVGDTVAAWVRSLKVVDKSVKPNHGWRDRFKTLAIELNMQPRTADAIQDHAGRTAGENYGDVTLTAKWTAIQMLPRYVLDEDTP